MLIMFQLKLIIIYWNTGYKWETWKENTMWWSQWPSFGFSNWHSQYKLLRLFIESPMHAINNNLNFKTNNYYSLWAIDLHVGSSNGGSCFINYLPAEIGSEPALQYYFTASTQAVITLLKMFISVAAFKPMIHYLLLSHEKSPGL